MQEAAREEEPGDDKSTLWAHSLNFPEKGCLLVAHPLMFTTQQMYFSQVDLKPCSVCGVSITVQCPRAWLPSPDISHIEVVRSYASVNTAMDIAPG